MLDVTGNKINARLNGHEVTIYFGKEKLELQASNVSCVLCGAVRNETGKQEDIVYVFKTTRVAVLEVQESGVQLPPQNSLFREIVRRINSHKFLGKPLCGGCKVEHGVLEDAESLFEGQVTPPTREYDEFDAAADGVFDEELPL